MISKYILASIVVLTSFCGSQPKTTYGVKAGFVYAWQAWSVKPGMEFYWTERPNDPRYGIDVGAFYESPDSSAICVSFEVHYSQKGVQGFSGIDELRGGLREIRTEYISLQVLAKLWLSDGSFSPYLIAGPRLNMPFHMSFVGFDDHYFPREGGDIGVTLGAGFDISGDSPGRFGLELRYSPTLTDNYPSGIIGMKNNAMELLLVFGL